jgi:hypothetical protein
MKPCQMTGCGGTLHRSRAYPLMLQCDVCAVFEPSSEPEQVIPLLQDVATILQHALQQREPGTVYHQIRSAHHGIVEALSIMSAIQNKVAG